MYYYNGKLIKKPMPNGLYDGSGEHPVLIDKNFCGWKVIYPHKNKIEKDHFGIITDSIEVLSTADNKTYTSKAKYYRSLKDHGNHVIEAGEHGKKREQQGDYNCRSELKQAVQQHLGR